MRIKRTLLIFAVILGVTAVGWQSLLAKPPGAPPVSLGEIVKVSLIDPLNLEGSGGIMIIDGEGFGTGEPSVSLGMYEDLVLTYYDDLQIVAELPSLDVGDYLLTVFPGNMPPITYDLTVSSPSVPTGMVAFFASETCPPGWTEETDASGRVLVGLQPSGLLGAMVGTALSDEENRSHDHNLNLSAGTTGTGGVHKHTGLVSLTGDHDHGGDTLGPNEDYQLVDCDDDFRCGAASTTHGHSIQWQAAHGHLIQEDPGHTHSIGGSSSTSSAAYTSDVMPYLQLLACTKD